MRWKDKVGLCKSDRTAVGPLGGNLNEHCRAFFRHCKTYAFERGALMFLPLSGSRWRNLFIDGFSRSGRFIITHVIR